MHLPGLLAYVDPVSGTIILQLIIAGAVGTVAFFRRSIGRALRSVARLWGRGGSPTGK